MKNLKVLHVTMMISLLGIVEMEFALDLDLKDTTTNQDSLKLRAVIISL